MLTRIKLIFVAAFVVISSSVLVQTGETQTQRVETAGEKFKNIQVLKHMPADQLGKVMNIMTASLNVNCDFCHVGYEFEKDDKEHKRIAREMITMTFELNRKYFEGKQEVSCNTCHNGQPHPRAMPNLAVTKREPRIIQPTDKPSAASVIERHEKLIGVRPRNAVIKSNRVEPDGKTVEPADIRISGSNVRVDTIYENYTVNEIFDGKDATKLGNGSPIELKPDEKEQVKREAQLLIADLRSIYVKFYQPVLERIDGNDVYRISATTSDGITDQLFFDLKSGLLRRRISATNTVLGDYNFQADYLDYKNLRGVTLPTTTKYAMPAVYWTRKIRSLEKTK